MKKILATVLATVMILSALACLAVIPASAEGEEGSGDWMTYARYKKYPKDDAGNYDYSLTPENTCAGYNYTDDGFHAYAEFKSENNETQKVIVASKEMVDLQQSVTMSVRIDEFKYGGDMWFSFTIWDGPIPEQGDGTCGSGQGFWSLIRPGEKESGMTFNGTWKTMESYISDKSYYDTSLGAVGGSATEPMTLANLGMGNVSGNSINDEGNEIEVDDEGRPIVTMDLQYDEMTDQYNLVICGVTVNQAAINRYLHTRFPDGMAYIGFTMHGNQTDTNTSCTILEFNGEKPVGNDSAAPKGTPEAIGPEIDPDTIEEGQPVLLLDAKNENGDFKDTGMLVKNQINYTANPDGSFTLFPQVTDSAWFMVEPRNSKNYNAKDFPYMAILLRNFCNCVFAEGETGCRGDEQINAYYCAGNVLSADNDHMIRLKGVEVHQKPGTEAYEAEDGRDYKLFILNFTDTSATGDNIQDWEGRINKVQVVFNNLVLVNEGQNNFDLCYAGFFKTMDEAFDYSENYWKNASTCNHEHKETVSAVPAECEVPGLTEGVQCQDCLKWIKQQEKTPMLGHDLVDATGYDATCTTTGLSDGQKCQREGCIYTTQKNIEALGHDNVFVLVDDATHKQVCSRCQEETDATSHNFEDKDGKQICKDCGFGCDHEDVEWKVEKAPTCTETGIERHRCKNCGAVVAVDGTPGSRDIAATGHTEEIVAAVAPTCTTKGWTEGKKCTVCGMPTKLQEEISELGHTEETVAGREATCTETGLTEGKKCSVCGAEIVAQTEIPVKDHTYENGVCTVCNEKETEKNTEPENPGDNKDNNNDTDKKTDDKKKGCGSVVGLGALAISATVALAGVMCFKKKED